MYQMELKSKFYQLMKLDKKVILNMIFTHIYETLVEDL